MDLRLLLLWNFVILCVFLPLASAQLQVTTTEGVVEGSVATDGQYYTFYGLYYGGNTGGENRFKDPPPPPTYPGTYYAINNNVMCAQPTPRGLMGTEDCLTLNVFTKNATTPKPVVVWLVSDEYTNSPIERSFRSLVTEDIVVVQINHRLSVFGFLCLGVAEAPGNAGLKDVTQALRWIKSNIAGFGGNPDNVILFGHGSGAAMVDLLTLSPLSSNLIHKAVVQSGSALAPWAVSYNPLDMAKQLAAKLNITTSDHSALARSLVTVSAENITTQLNTFKPLGNTVLFAPCIENIRLSPNNTFLADAPINLLKSGNYNTQINYITGYTSMEGSMRADEAAYDGWLEQMEANFTRFLQPDLNFGTNLTSAERSIRQFYFDQKQINQETVRDFIEYHGDTLVLVSVIRGAKTRAATSTASVRLLQFAYKGTTTEWPFQSVPIEGARHGAVMNFLLQFELRPNVDLPVSQSIINRFVNFFRTGNPTLTLNGDVWEGVTSTTTNFYGYSGGDGPVENSLFLESAQVNPHTQRMNFWENLYHRYYVPPQPVAGSALRVASFGLLLLVTQLLIL